MSAKDDDAETEQGMASDIGEEGKSPVSDRLEDARSEVETMRVIAHALANYTDGERDRILTWVIAFFGRRVSL